MGTIYLVRHGQASFGAADYDQLSALGRAQSERLGAWWRECLGDALHFDLALTGTLRRQIQTWDEVARGAGLQGTPLARWPGLDEYDGTALVRAVAPELRPRADTPEQRRAWFRLLRQGLAAWMRGTTRPEGMPSYAEFAAGVMAALDRVRAQGAERAVVVSSGGPISTAVGQILGVPPETTIDLNLRYRNSAVTAIEFTSTRLHLISYNALPHLQAPPWRDCITFV